MSNWREYFKRKREKSMEPISSTVTTSTVNTSGVLTTTAGLTGMSGTPWMSGTSAAPVYSGVTTTVASVPYLSSISVGPTYISSGYASMGASIYTPPAPTHLITLSNAGKEIVKLLPDGSVVWNDEIKVNEAAEAFSRSLSMGSEIAAGISKKAKSRIRDSIFEDIISIAKDKGSLTAEDLTYLLEASKIMEKLKGDRE